MNGNDETDLPGAYWSCEVCGADVLDELRGCEDCINESHDEALVTAPLPPDPADVTDADRAFARAALAEFKRDLMPGEWLDLTTTLAAALAAERAAVARPVLALAEELEAEGRAAMERSEAMPRTDENVRHHTAERRHARVAHHAASAVRGVVAAALGETGGGQ